MKNIINTGFNNSSKLTVSSGNNLQEILLFGKNKNTINLLSAQYAHRVVKVYLQVFSFLRLYIHHLFHDEVIIL